MNVDELNKRRAKKLNALYSDSSCQTLHPESLFACVRAKGHLGDHLALGPGDDPTDRRRGKKSRFEWPTDTAVAR